MRVISFLRARRNLMLLGVACEFVYVFYFLQKFPLLVYARGPYMDMGQMTGHSHAGLVAYVVAFGALFLVLGLAWREVRDLADRATLWVILGFGCIFAATMVFVYPVTAIDVFAYVSYDLELVQYHVNSLLVAPASIVGDPLMGLGGGWSSQPAPYGPLGMLVQAVPSLLAGRNVLATVILLKIEFSLMAIGAAWIVYRVLRRIRPQAALAGVLLIAWNPLILFETAANGHNDIAAGFFTLLALLLMVEDALLLAPLVLTVAALMKYTPAVLLPVFLVYGMAKQPVRRGRVMYLLSSGLLCLAITCAAYAPFWHGFDTLNSIQAQNHRYLYSFSTFVTDLLPNAITQEHAAVLGRVLFFPAYLPCLWLARRDVEGLLRGSFLAMFSLLLLGTTNFLYWYAVLAVLLAATVPRLAERFGGFVLAAAVEMLTVSLNIYVWVWVGVTGSNFRPLDAVSYAAMFLLPGILLLALARRPELINASWPRVDAALDRGKEA